MSLCGKFAIDSVGNWRSISTDLQRDTQPLFPRVGPDGRPTNDDVSTIITNFKYKSPPGSPRKVNIASIIVDEGTFITQILWSISHIHHPIEMNLDYEN